MRVLFIVLVTLCLSPLFGQSTQVIHVDSLFATYKANTPGVAVLLLQDGHVIYKKAFGAANLEYQIPITSNTVFNANSLSKQFVAFAVYLLEKEHKISLEDPIQKYIPDFPEYEHPIKIKHLLSHTSGIRDQWGLLSLAGFRFDDFISTEQILHFIKKQQSLNFETDTKHAYSHSNYTLLARIIEVASNQSFSEFMQEHIFSPLHMNDSFYLTNTKDIIKNSAYSYKKVDDHFEKVILNYQNPGPTNLMSTLDDLEKWVLNFDKHNIGDENLFKSYNEIYTLANGDQAIAATIGKEQIIGCKGQYYRNYKGLDLYSHGGSLGGYRAYIGRFPNEKFSIVLLSNDNAFYTNATALSIADIFLEDKQIGTVDEKSSTVEAEKKKKPLAEIHLEKYTGHYYNKEIDTTFHITLKNDALYLVHKRLSDKPLKMESENQFSTTLNFQTNILFVENTQDNTKGLQISNFGVDALFFKKIQ